MLASRRPLFFLFPALLVCLCLGACRSSSAPEERSPPAPPQTRPGTGAPSDPPPAAPRGGGADACASLTRTHCLQSPDCTLEKVGDDGSEYRCRPEIAPCETDIRQSEDVQSACAARPSCRFEPGKCYCHCRGNGKTEVPDGPEAEDCDCACGGGPPPTCTASSG